jgi:hypothetical protein
VTRRLRQDESGVALGLAVILVVLIGVLAAGFLAVVRSDLLSTISANHGQRAFDLADAGARAAAARLRSDANPEHYDADAAENAEWSYVPPDGGPPGKTLPLGNGSAIVTIRYLIPSTEQDQQEEESHAPEPVPGGLSDYPDRDYFLVVSEGASGETRRKVEAIVYATGPGEVGQWSWREVYE